jgi:hypothetical protein
MNGKGIDRTALVALAVLAFVSAVIWVISGRHPIYTFGMAAELWLLGLMLKGLLSPPFKPARDELDSSDTAKKPGSY